MGTSAPYPCPCCGYLVFDEPPGSLDVCPICWWEDDPIQLADPYCVDGANDCSLDEAQRRFFRRDPEAADPAALRHPRNAAFRRDERWQPLTTRDDTAPPSILLRKQGDWPDDPSTLYYWRQAG